MTDDCDGAHEGASPDAADPGETRSLPAVGAGQGEAGTLPLSRLLEKHSIATRIDLDPALHDEDRSFLPLHDREGERYENVEELAKGGMGIVLRSVDKDLRRHVAMKVITPEKRQHRETMVRFVEEAQITGQLEHPNIVPVHELAVDDEESLFYTMKLIQGHTLKEILDGLGAGRRDFIEKYDLSHLLNIFLKACDAVAFAHSKGVVHRDLKPQNIMIGDFGEVIVLDWGIAKILTPEQIEKEEGRRGSDRTMKAMRKVLAERRAGGRRAKPSKGGGVTRIIDSVRSRGTEDTARTLAGQIMGSPGFMAPEQAFGEVDEIDRRTDIYSLGAILFSILSLHPHVDGDSVQEVLETMASNRKDSPIDLIRRMAADGQAVALPHCPAGRIPVALSKISMKALETSKRDRYQQVAQLQKDILSYLGGYVTSAEKVNLSRKCLLFVRRHRFASIVWAVVVLIAIAAAYPMIRAIVNLDRELEEAEALVDELTEDRMELASDIDILRRSGLEARAASDELVRLMEDWQWEAADRKARSLMVDRNLSALLLPPEQLMSLAQLRLFDGEIDDAVLLLELSGNSRLREVSEALAGVLTTENEEPIDLPETAEEALRIHAELSGLGHAEAALAADCLMAAVLKELAGSQPSVGGDGEGFRLAVEWMNRGAGKDQSITVTSGGEGASSLTIACSGGSPVRLEILRWLPVETLDVRGCRELDVSALREARMLKTLHLAKCAIGLEELRDLELERIGYEDLMLATEFWSRYGDGESGE